MIIIHFILWVARAHFFLSGPYTHIYMLSPFVEIASTPFYYIGLPVYLPPTFN